MIFTTDSTSSDDTERLGELLGSLISPPLTMELVGDLGAGKTTLVRGLARGFGSQNIVSSPSFTLSQIYENEDGHKLYHFDLYRLGDDPGILQDELTEALADSEAMIVVEWGQSVNKLLPPDTISLTILNDPEAEDVRQIKIRYTPEHRDEIMKLETLWDKSRP